MPAAHGVAWMNSWIAAILGNLLNPTDDYIHQQHLKRPHTGAASGEQMRLCMNHLMAAVPFRQFHIQASHRTSLFRGDRKSTRLNSSHVSISYAVFCL